MRRYSTESFSTAVGVSMATSSTRLRAMPAPVSIRPSNKAMVAAVWTARCTRLVSPAPKNWEITTPAPTDAPWAKAISRLMSALLEPTAASALLPT